MRNCFGPKYYSYTSNFVAIDFAKINIIDWYSICKHSKSNGDNLHDTF